MAPKRPSIAMSSTLSAFFTRNSCIGKKLRLDCENVDQSLLLQKKRKKKKKNPPIIVP